MSVIRTPLVSVIVFARGFPSTITETLRSVERQAQFADIEVIVADGTTQDELAPLFEAFPWVHRVSVPNANMPVLKGRAIEAARAEIVAILDPTDTAEPDWITEIIAGLSAPDATAVGGTVLLKGSTTAANVAAYLFEYGAFNPPLEAGITAGDLPGNNVAYRRAFLREACANILANEGFNKPFCHERIRACKGQLVLRPSMRVHHITQYRFLNFALRRFHYGRCFGAKRWGFSSTSKRWMYTLLGPTVPLLLAIRHTRRALSHPQNRYLLPSAWPALIGICLFWGAGECLGYWFGAGRSCERLY